MNLENVGYMSVNYVSDLVSLSMRDSAWNSVWDFLRDSVGNSVRDSVVVSVWNPVWDSVNIGLQEPIREERGR